MKKTFCLLCVTLALCLLASCSTTGGDGIEPVSRTVELQPFDDNHIYTEDLLWRFINEYADTFADEDCSIKRDSGSKTIIIDGLVLDTNVGMTAQSGKTEVRLGLAIEGGSATCTICYVDSYTYMRLGPITKKVSQGMTEFGMEIYSQSCQYLLDTFEFALQNHAHAYSYENGWYDAPEPEVLYEQEVMESASALEGLGSMLPVEITVADFGTRLDDGTVLGELVKIDASTKLQIKGLSTIYVADRNLDAIGKDKLFNDEMMVFVFDTRNSDPATVAMVFHHTSSGDWDGQDALYSTPVTSGVSDTGCYDAYPVIILSEQVSFKPGYYDVVITDGYSNSPAYVITIHIGQRPDGFAYR